MTVTAIVLYVLIGVGVAAGVDFDLQDRFPERWRGATRIAGVLLAAAFWPVWLAGIMTLILISKADR